MQYFRQRERSLRDVPAGIRWLAPLMLLLQLWWHSQQPPPQARAQDLPPPLSADNYVMASLGEPVTAAKVLNLWLQAFDNQPGISIPFSQLDYRRIIEWLDTILALDPAGHYPLLVAARVYGSVSDPQRQRMMMDYLYDKFQHNPQQNWRWLAHAVITAKHELKDMPLALKYADALASTDTRIPYWARDMKIIVLEDMGQLEAAKVLVGGLIASGEIRDLHEIRFLTQKLEVLQKKLSAARHNVENSTVKSR